MQIKLIDFDTIIFDLDFTIWDGCEKDFWAKKLEEPLVLKNEYIFDKNQKYIKLQNGIRETLSFLRSENKNLGFVTRGGLLETEFFDQPPIKCLNLFDILHFFNHQRTVIYKTDLKSQYIKSSGKTIYIDDNIIDINDIKNNHSDILVVDRNSFNQWQELI